MNQAQPTTVEADSVSLRVIEAVADAKGVDPMELTPALYEVIDPDALDHVFATAPTDGRTGGRVIFRYTGYDVTVCDDGCVSVLERRE